MDKNTYFCTAIFLAISSFSSMAADSLTLNVSVITPSNTPEAVVDLALNTICPTIISGGESKNSDLISICNFVGAGSSATSEEIAAVIKELSPKANTSIIGLSSPRTSFGQVSGIGLRLSALRSSTKQPKHFGFKSSHYRKSFNALESDEPGSLFSQRLSGFVNVTGASSEQLESQTEIGYDSANRALTFGIDYRLKSSTFVGIASQYGQTSADLTDKGSQLNADQFGLTLYGSHFINDNWYLDATISSSQQNLEIDRQLDINLNQTVLSETANGETKSGQIGWYLGTGYTLPLQDGYSGLISFGISYSSTSIDAYNETNAGNLGLAIDSQKLTSLTTSTTLQLAKVFSTRQGVLIPQLTATWIHETSTSEQDINAEFLSDTSNTTFSFSTPKPDSDYFILGADLQMILPMGRMVYLKYTNVRLLRDKIEQSLSAGIRLEF